MSRTTHQRSYTTFHNMRVANRRKGEEAVLAQLEDEGITSFRHSNRVKSFWSLIPEPWDDKPCASGTEYHNKAYWYGRRVANESHYTKGSE